MYEVRKTKRLQDFEKELNKAEREGWELVATHAYPHSVLGGTYNNEYVLILWKGGAK